MGRLNAVQNAEPDIADSAEAQDGGSNRASGSREFRNT
jgi:hypothetical protein